MKYYAHFLASFESRVDINSRARKIETIKLFTVYFQLTTTAQRRMKEAQTDACDKVQIRNASNGLQFIRFVILQSHFGDHLQQRECLDCF